MQDFLQELGIQNENMGAKNGQDISTSGEWLKSYSPTDGSVIASVKLATKEDYEKVMQTALANFDRWRMTPAPKRGEIVRQMGDALRENKEALGKLVSLEMGKILAEGIGEVQEMIE